MGDILGRVVVPISRKGGGFQKESGSGSFHMVTGENYIWDVGGGRGGGGGSGCQNEEP